MNEPALVFLKLGGSLITDKHTPQTPLPAVIQRLAGEIAAARLAQPGLALIIGHGSGSFGHIPARQYGTRQGVSTPAEWEGFVEVWRAAAALNRQIMDAFQAAGLPAMAFAPSASVVAHHGQVARWELNPIQSALQAGLIPVIYGDVVFDTARGGTILSTEDLFGYLALHLTPQRILLAGIEPGVWSDFPACTRLIPEIRPASLSQVGPALTGAQAADVTGGMESKVRQSLELVQAIPGLEIMIFSGAEAGLVQQVLSGARAGTQIAGPL